MKISCTVPALPGANTRPRVAIVTSPASRSEFAKYLATWVANWFEGSWP